MATKIAGKGAPFVESNRLEKTKLPLQNRHALTLYALEVL